LPAISIAIIFLFFLLGVCLHMKQYSWEYFKAMHFQEKNTDVKEAPLRALLVCFLQVSTVTTNTA